jgi:signal peptidase II
MDQVVREATMATLLRRILIVAIAVALGDEMTKALVRASLEVCTAHHPAGCDSLRIGGTFELVRLENKGSALGFNQGLWIWVPIAVGGLILIAWYARAGRPTRGLAVATGLQLGGAVGNLVDRLLAGGVTDFIYMGTGPVFNLADVALLAGTVLASWKLMERPGFCPLTPRPAEARWSDTIL